MEILNLAGIELPKNVRKMVEKYVPKGITVAILPEPRPQDRRSFHRKPDAYAVLNEKLIVMLPEAFKNEGFIPMPGVRKKLIKRGIYGYIPLMWWEGVLLHEISHFLDFWENGIRLDSLGRRQFHKKTFQEIMVGLVCEYVKNEKEVF